MFVKTLFMIFHKDIFSFTSLSIDLTIGLMQITQLKMQHVNTGMVDVPLELIALEDCLVVQLAI